MRTTRSIFPRGLESSGFGGQSFRPLGPVRLGGGYGYGLGQTSYDAPTIQSSIASAQSQMDQVNSWMNANPNYQAQLGANAGAFASALADARAVYPTVSGLNAQVSGQTGPVAIADSDYNALIQWQNDIMNLTNWMIYAQNAPPPGAPTGTVQPSSTLPGVITPIAQALPGLLNKPAPPKPAAPKPAPAAPISPWLIGGAAAVGVGILALVLKR